MGFHISKLKTICCTVLVVLIGGAVAIGLVGRNVKKVVLSGDPEVMSYVEKLAYYYSANIKPGLSIDVNAPGASQAVKDVTDGLADYGFVARKLSSSEVSENIVVSGSPIATEAYVVVVNSNFPLSYINSNNIEVPLISTMPREYIAEMFYKKGDQPDQYRGDFNYWRAYIRDVGSTGSISKVDSEETIQKREELFGKMPILPVQRPRGDGLRESFEEYFNMEALINSDKGASGKNIQNYSDKVGVTKDNDGEILEYIKNNDGSVGYVRYSTYKANKYDPKTNPKGVKLLPVSSVNGNLITSLDAENFSSQNPDKYWPLRRNFNYFFNSKQDSSDASDFIRWATTGFTVNEFNQYVADGKVTVFDDKSKRRTDGTIPYIIGAQDSIISDYEGSRKRIADEMLQKYIDKAKEEFPYHSGNEGGKISYVEINDKEVMNLPIIKDNVKYSYEIKVGSYLTNTEYFDAEGKTLQTAEGATNCRITINSDNIMDSDPDKTLNRIQILVTYTAGNTEMSTKDPVYQKIHKSEENVPVWFYVTKA